MFGADGGAEDLHDEYLKATLKKAGLPDHIEVAEMVLEYAIRDKGGTVWQCVSRAEAEATSEDTDTVVVREKILTEWREATPRASS